jgi:glycosyltransferase involved in cell wall biosynthesis
MEAILEQTEDILIINDGTTYETLQLLEECIDIKKVQVL